MCKAVRLNMERQQVKSAAKENTDKVFEEQTEEEEPMVLEETVQMEEQESLKKQKIPSIRVLLMTTGYESYEHEMVSGICDGEPFIYTAHSPELEVGTVRIEPKTEGVTLTSVERQCGQPVYFGSLEIAKNGETLNIINEVPLETYLKSVVPGEMPASYEMEALMAQAVCARTYAWKHMERNGVWGYPADVDDSVNFQVYGNISPQERTSRAVEETAGKILCQNGEPVEAYYFSTSAGATSTDEIWGTEQEASFLKSVKCDFDADMPWSKWEAELPWSKVEERAQQLSGGNGALLSVEIQRKNQSGAALTLDVVTEDGGWEVEGEYAIREFLSPKGYEITQKNGSKTQGGVLLPSAYFTMELYPKEKICITGGGYGHGVGMSQNGADKMAEEGYTWEEILEYFFKDIEIRTLFEDGN